MTPPPMITTSAVADPCGAAIGRSALRDHERGAAAELRMLNEMRSACGPQRSGGIELLSPQQPVEVLHDRARALVVHAPERGDRGPATGRVQRGLQRSDSLAADRHA